MCVSSVPLFTDFFLPVQNLFLAFAVFARVHTCVCMCVVCVPACMRARARVCVRACAHLSSDFVLYRECNRRVW